MCVRARARVCVCVCVCVCPTPFLLPVWSAISHISCLFAKVTRTGFLCPPVSHIFCARQSISRMFPFLPNVFLHLQCLSIVHMFPVCKCHVSCSPTHHRLVGLVVKVSTSRAADPRFDSRFLRGDFFRVESYLGLGTPVATLPGVIGSTLGLLGPVLVNCD